MKEIWKDIPGYEGLYKVSNLGNVKSMNYKKTNKSKNLKLYSKNDYVRVSLCKKTKVKKHLVHRLVAKAFIKKEIGQTDINHIDGNKINNHLDNLEWCTKSENTLHAIKTGLITFKRGKDHHNSQRTGNKNPMFGKTGSKHHGAKSVICLSIDGDFIKKYKCIKEGSIETGASHIYGVLKGERNQSGGFKWKRSD